jgi:hypothetical protein
MFRQPREGHYNKDVIHIDAPIVPGKSAAGISIGSLVSELLATVRDQPPETPPYPATF